MRPRTRLVGLAVLAGAWMLIRDLHLAATWGLHVERALSRGVVLLFVALLVSTAWALASARARRLLARPAHAALFTGVAAAYAITHAFLTRVLVVDRGLTGAFYVHVGDGYGPLTVWPTLAFAWPAARVAGQLSAGRALVIAALALVVATSALLVMDAWRTRRGGRGAAGAGGAVTGAFTTTACPGCGPPMAALLAASAGALAAPVTAALANPLSPLFVLLEVAAPLVALAGLAYVVHRTRGDAGTRWRTRPARAPRVALALAPLVAAPLAFAGFPRGVTPVQNAIYRFTGWVAAGALFLTLTVIVLLLYFAIRYRHDPDRVPDGPEPSPRARRALITAYVVVPALVVFGLGAASYGLLVDIETIPDGTVHVDVIGVRFGWHFQYPDGESTMNEMRVQSGEVVVLNLTTGDVMHSFFVPDLGVKQDLMPNYVTQTWFQATKAGTYRAFCAEHCGPGHRDMMASVVVFPPGAQEKPYGTATPR